MARVLRLCHILSFYATSETNMTSYGQFKRIYGEDGPFYSDEPENRASVGTISKITLVRKIGRFEGAIATSVWLEVYEDGAGVLFGPDGEPFMTFTDDFDLWVKLEWIYGRVQIARDDPTLAAFYDMKYGHIDRGI